MSDPSSGLTATFLALHIAGGIVGLPLVVLSIIASHKPSRHPTLLNFCATWVFASLIYTLLLYAGKQNDDHPPFGLCLAQASMASGAFPMTSMAAVALVAHIWHGLGPARPWSQFGLASKNLATTRLVGLLVAPYAVFLLLVIPSAVIGHRNPSRITSQDKLFYCTIDSNGLNLVAQIFVMISMAFILLFEGLIILEIFRNAYVKSGLNRSGYRLFFVRLLGFAIYAVISLVVAALLVHNERSLAPYVLQASLPVCVFIFIGTQKEVLAMWSRFLPFKMSSSSHFDGNYHFNKSTTTLTREDRPPTPAFMPNFVQLNELKSDGSSEENVAEVFKSSVPFRMPKRPPAKQQHTINSFFNDPMPPVSRPTPAHTTEPHRNIYESPPPVQEPLPPPEPVPPQPYVVDIPEDNYPAFGGMPPQTHHVLDNGMGQDLNTIIASQKETISRLMDEAGYANRALDRLKNIEQTFHKAQNALTQERRTASQLRGRVNQLEFDLATQQTILNEKVVQCKALEDTNKKLDSKVKQLDKLSKSLDSALKDSVDKEMTWRKKYEALKAEHDVVVDDRDTLASDLHLFMDYFVSRDSPLEWDPPKGGASSVRQSPQNAFPEEIRQRIKQRASTPTPRPFSKSSSSSLRRTRRQTDATQASKGSGSSTPAVPPPPSSFKATKTGLTAESLDRLRPKMLELSGNMELSEKVSGLEELVREQAAIIEGLENAVDDERRERIRLHLEGSMGSWDIPNSISSSMIVRSSVMEADSRGRRASSGVGIP